MSLRRNEPDCRQASLAAFEDWLLRQGVRVLDTDGQAFITFCAAGITASIRIGGNGRWVGTNGGLEAWHAYCNGRPIHVFSRKRVKPPPAFQRAALIRQLVKRDGRWCFYCDWPMQPEDMSIEHLVPRSAAGSNAPWNLALAHSDCNRLAGELSLVEKIRLRDRVRVAAPD